MINTYYSAIFTFPADFAQNGYMIVDPSGNVTFSDVNGNPLTLPYPCQYYIPTPDVQSPNWGV